MIDRCWLRGCIPLGIFGWRRGKRNESRLIDPSEESWRGGGGLCFEIDYGQQMKGELLWGVGRLGKGGRGRIRLRRGLLGRGFCEFVVVLK